MSDPITVEQNIEKAVEELFRTAIDAAGVAYNVNYVTTVYDTQYCDRLVSYPCVVIACSPFQNDTPESILGYCPVNITCITEQNDDKFGQDINQMCSIVFPLMVEDSVGPLVFAPWLLCGIDDTGATDATVEEDENINIRSREYRIALAKVS